MVNPLVNPLVATLQRLRCLPKDLHLGTYAHHAAVAAVSHIESAILGGFCQWENMGK